MNIYSNKIFIFLKEAVSNRASERSVSENTLVLQAGHQRSKGGVEDLVRQRQDVLFVDLVLLPFPSTAWPHLLYQVLSKKSINKWTPTASCSSSSVSFCWWHGRAFQKFQRKYWMFWGKHSSLYELSRTMGSRADIPP